MFLTLLPRAVDVSLLRVYLPVNDSLREKTPPFDLPSNNVTFSARKSRVKIHGAYFLPSSRFLFSFLLILCFILINSLRF